MVFRTARRPTKRLAALRHEWIVSADREDQVAISQRLGGGDHVIDAHRNHRGPFGATGALVCTLFERHRAAATRAAIPRLVTLLAVAPDLRTMLPVPAEVDRSFAFSREGNRRSWSQRIAHGAVDFVFDCLADDHAHRPTILFYGADGADTLDLAFIGLLLRRADPAALLVQVGSAHGEIEALLPHLAAGKIRIVRTVIGGGSRRLASAIVPPPRGGASESPRSACHSLRCPAEMPPAAAGEQRVLAARHVEANCVDDDPLATAAYAALDPAERRALHRERIAVLERQGAASTTLGALPLHHERAGTGPEPLAAASIRCMQFAWYEAALDWAIRARALCDRPVHACVAGEMTRNMIFALLLLERYDETERLCARCLAESSDPALLSHACYAQAILHARLRDPQRRDYPAARTWIERALAFTGQLPSSDMRATNLAFLRNTLALVEMRCGNGAGALQLLSDAIAYLAREAPACFPVESVILFHNRARLHRAAGDTAAAIADLTTVLELEPSNAEAAFDRGLLHQNADRHADAVQDYDAAVLWGPPDVETLLNRARSLGALGRWQEALDDYGRLLAIDPDDVRALTDRACIRRALGDSGARADVERGLSLDPGNARLLCLRGLLDLAEGKLDAALASLTAAIAADPRVADAWANRATVAHRLGRDDDALADLEHALDLRDDPLIRCNRARILEARGKLRRAADEYRRALSLPGGNAPAAQRGLDRCCAALPLLCDDVLVM